MESLYLLILLFFIIILIVPLGFKLKLSFSLKSNRGALSIKLWFIWLKVAKLKVKNGKIYLIQKCKTEEVETEITEPELKFLKFFNDEVKDKLKCRNIFVCTNVGMDNPFYSALISTTLHNLILALFILLKNKHQRCSLKLCPTASFENFNFIIALAGRFSLSILDVLYSFIVSILRTKSDKNLLQKIGY